MYIPLLLYGGKSAQQLSYGFNILDKLECCPHENQNPADFECGASAEPQRRNLGISNSGLRPSRVNVGSLGPEGRS